MSMDFEQWLAELDADAILREIRELESDQRILQEKVRARHAALALLKQWAPDRLAEAAERERAMRDDEPSPVIVRTDEPQIPAGDEPPIEPDEAAEMDSGPPEGFRVVRDMDEKEEILVAILAGAPKGLHMKEIRARLAEQKLHFAGTPPRGVLWRARQTGVLESPRQGVYMLRQPPEGWDPQASQVIRRG